MVDLPESYAPIGDLNLDGKIFYKVYADFGEHTYGMYALAEIVNGENLVIVKDADLYIVKAVLNYHMNHFSNSYIDILINQMNKIEQE